MEYSQIRLFTHYANNEVDKWRDLIMGEVIHTLHGRGKIVEVRYREGAGIYLDIVFETGAPQPIAYRPDALNNTKFFPSVTIPDSLNAQLIAAKREMEHLEQENRLKEERQQEVSLQKSQQDSSAAVASVNQDIQTVVAQFLLQLEEDLKSGNCTTEAKVRDVFRSALIASQISPTDIRYEEPHLHLGGSRGQIDMLVLASEALERSAVEFKYNRAIPSGYNQPRSQKAGELFADLSRLLRWPNADLRYFIYLTDGEMYRYLTGGHNICGRVFQRSSGYRVELDSNSFNDESDTLRNRMGSWPCKAALRNLAFKGFPVLSHYLWIFQVTSLE